MEQNFIKKTIMETKAKFVIGPYKDPQIEWRKNTYNRNIVLREPISVPFVEIWDMSTTDIIAKLCWDENTKTLSNPQNFKPAIVVSVDHDFDGIDKEKVYSIHDLNLHVRSNMFRILQNESAFPLKPDTNLFVKNVHIIGLNNENHFRRKPLQTGVIVSPLVTKPDKVKNNLKTMDFKRLNITIETIFQTAYLAGVDVLILPDFIMDDDDSYVHNVTNIINYQITKYGYFFRYIFISIPREKNQAKMNIFNAYNKFIIRPQNYIN